MGVSLSDYLREMVRPYTGPEISTGTWKVHSLHDLSAGGWDVVGARLFHT
jgi:hypothetical protein